VSVSKYLSSSLAIGAVLATAHVAAAAAPNGSAAALRAVAGGADCKNARVCAVIGRDTPPAVTVVRSKNVAAVSHPSTGVYCIKPKAGVVSVSKVVPSVTVNWLFSANSDLLAFYADNTGDCPADRIEVLTYDLQQNRSDRVGFNIVVD